MKYKIYYTGFAYVEADSEEEAREKVLYEKMKLFIQKHM